MNEPIEQAVYGSEAASGYRFLATSPGFRAEWLYEAQRLCTAFGECPSGVTCPACFFVQPFGPEHVAVVQVSDQGRDDAGRPGTLRFYLLIVPRVLYAALEGDPFHIADTFPPPQPTDTLSTLQWTTRAPTRRTVEQLQTILNVPHSAALLGAAQALIDGGRVAFPRSEPDRNSLRDLWALLPSSSRCELWLATFALGNVAAFHAVAAPLSLLPSGPQWIHEAQAGDYPEGRYELNLQIAVEAGNQSELDGLLARKTRIKTTQLALLLLAALLGIVLVPSALFFLGQEAVPGSSPPVSVLELPPENECPPLGVAERQGLAEKLQAVAKRLDIRDLPTGSSDKELTLALAALDAKLGVPEAKQTRKPLSEYGPLQRQVRALLWTQDVDGYTAQGLNTVEMLEKLEKKLRHDED